MTTQSVNGSQAPVSVPLANGGTALFIGGANFALIGGRTVVRLQDGAYTPVARPR